MHVMKVCDIYKHFGHLITKMNLFLIESVAIANNGIVTSQTVFSFNSYISQTTKDSGM